MTTYVKKDLEVTGKVTAGGGGNFGGKVVTPKLIEVSDERLKSNIVTITDALQTIIALRCVSFDWDINGSETDGEHAYGLIAQEVANVLPDVVTDFDFQGSTYKGVSYSQLIGVIIEAIKQINANGAVSVLYRTDLYANGALLKVNTDLDIMNSQYVKVVFNAANTTPEGANLTDVTITLDTNTSYIWSNTHTFANVNVGGKLITHASNASYAGLNLPQGVIPSSPVDGDVWTTSSGVYARIDGVTIGPFGAASTANNDTANASANLVAVYLDNNLIMANANLNFNNTVDANVTVTANAINKRANISITVPNLSLAYDQANTANVVAQTAGALADTANSNAAAANVTGQSAFTLATTANNNAAAANVTGQSAFTLANTANTLATAANTLANVANVTANLALYTRVYANSTLVGLEKNLSFTSANTSNLTIVGIDDSANGNVVIQFDNPKAGGSGNGGSGNVIVSDGSLVVNTATPTVSNVTVNTAAAFIWSAAHKFTLVGDGGNFGAIQIDSTLPQLNFYETDAAANAGHWSLSFNGGQLRFRTFNDINTAGSNFLTVDRSNTVITALAFGNSTDAPQHTFYGIPNGRSILISGTNNVGLGLYNSTGGANAKYWQMYSSTSTWRMGFVDDGLSAVNDIFAANRTGFAVTNIFYGNATNNPGHTFYASAANQVNVQGPSGQYVNLEMVVNAGTAGSTGFVFGQASDGTGIMYNRSNAPAKIATNGTYRFIISAAGAIQFVTGYGVGDIRSDSSGNLTANAHFGDFGLQDTHGTYTSFEASGFTMPYGCSYVQNTTNGPGISGATQYYHQRMGLGKEYCNQYAMDWAIPRTPSGGSPYMSVRFAEGGTWTAWSKIYAGFADTSTYSQHWWSTSHYGTYYLDNNWDGTYWYITSSHGSPVRVGYADYCNAGSARYVTAAIASDTSTNNGSIEVRNNGSTGDSNKAAISFHCQSQYGMNLHLRPDGYFGIGGWSSAAWRWYSDPSGNMVASGNVTAYSDARLKTNIRTISNALDQVARLRGVYFDWNNNPANANKSSKNSLGLIAQEIQKVFPELVTTGVDGDTLTVAYAPLVGLLVEAIKELRQEVGALKEMVNTK